MPSCAVARQVGTIGRMSDADHRGHLGGRAIARWRLRSQRVSGPERFASASAAVRGLLGVQAENHAGAAWAVATRTSEPDMTSFDRQFDQGAFLRTHVLRPTWHYVHQEDIRWLLALTAPRIRRSLRYQQQALGVPDAALERARRVIVDALDGGAHLTRGALAPYLREEGLGFDGPHLTLFTFDAELEALVCSGRMQGGEQTYAMLEARAPDARQRSRSEALAEIALRYVRGHGPTTEADLAYWAGLTLTDVRRGLTEVAGQLRSFELDGRTYWYEGEMPADEPAAPPGHLLLILDELYRGYERRSRMHIDVAGAHPPGREAAIGMALLDGQLIGTWQRRTTRAAATFVLSPYRQLDVHEVAALDDAAERYGRFAGRTTAVEMAQLSG